MPMQNPCHPGEIVRDAIESLGRSVTSAAEGLGVSRKTLSALVNGRSGVSPEMALRLEKAVGSTAETWLRLQMAFDLAQARAQTRGLKIKKLTPAG